MSASLVGSEMCIRDRQYAASSTLHALHGPCCKLTDNAFCPVDRAMRRSCCLLYTSDAADDM
eukprot:4943029-Alexandrium_andersonii.AAC.1